MPPTEPAGRSSRAPERWATDAGTRDVATLTIPADAKSDRCFEIDCRFVVRRRDDAVGAWHAMKVTADGALEWQRRIPTSNPGSTDSLDLRFRRELPAGRALRIVATTELHGALRVGLTIRAEED